MEDFVKIETVAGAPVFIRRSHVAAITPTGYYVPNRETSFVRFTGTEWMLEIEGTSAEVWDKIMLAPAAITEE